MLLTFVVLYLLLSIGIGVAAGTRVKNSKDFAVAGRHLPLPVVTATVFATWFGAEAVFGVSATFATEGLRGVVADPFGSSLCLVLAGIFFARYLYRLNILTLGDFFRLRYGRGIEVLTTLAIVASYLGWVSAQIKALGLILNMVTDGALSEPAGMLVGTLVVLTYTTLGGMLSVAILDFVQMGVVIGGLLFIASLVADQTGGVAPVIDSARLAGKLDFFPPPNLAAWLSFVAAWVTMMLGSIPQQDVFQRITSARTAQIALWGSMFGAGIYFCFTFVPMFIAYASTLVDPQVFGGLLEADPQRLLPTLVMTHTPLLAQVIFFGAVLSAIMSCSSATLLAPSVSFAENIIRGAAPGMSDRRFLWVMRATIVCFASVVLVFALNSEASIFKMVENAYKVTLAGAFVPLIAGALWQRATTQGAYLAIFLGIGGWLVSEFAFGAEALLPPQLAGLALSCIGMCAGSLLPQVIRGHGEHLARPRHAHTAGRAPHLAPGHRH
ncbi:MAG: sodium:solute symporter [Rhodocyclaceae bacterium]|nr:sodium:solute symporter [Rhodocyclaceae bacterium]